MHFLPIPPLGVLLDQQLIETSTTTSDGVSKKTAYLQQNIFSTACTVDDDKLTLHPIDIRVKLASPNSGKSKGLAFPDGIVFA